MDHKPGEMSGGQQQRVGIARAFVDKPKVIFADEPTGNLDSATTEKVMKMLIDISEKNNITFVTVSYTHLDVYKRQLQGTERSSLISSNVLVI